MKEYIDKYTRIADDIKNAYEEGYADGKRDAVVHGHWIKIGDQYSIRNMKCSNCGEEVFGDADTEKYCFNCGSLMDEVTE